MDASQKKDDLPVHATPNHHHPKMDVLRQTFLRIILAAKWLVQHSSTACPPNSSDDLCIVFYINPLPSFFYAMYAYGAQQKRNLDNPEVM